MLNLIEAGPRGVPPGSEHDLAVRIEDRGATQGDLVTNNRSQLPHQLRLQSEEEPEKSAALSAAQERR